MSHPLFNTIKEFVEIFQTLRSLDEIKQGYKTLIKTDIPAELVKEFNLFDIVRKVPKHGPFEKLKDKLLAKIEELEKAYEQKSIENVEPVTEKSSRFEKKPLAKTDEKKSRKRAAEGPGSMEPQAKKPVPMPTSRRPENWIPKKRTAPTRPPQAHQPQKTTEAAKDTKKPVPTMVKPMPPPPIISTSSIQGFRIPKKKKIVPAGSVEKPAEVVKDAPKPVTTSVFAPFPAPGVVKEESTEPVSIPPMPPPPTLTVKPMPPVPLLSLDVEKPAWLSDDILVKYRFSH